MRYTLKISAMLVALAITAWAPTAMAWPTVSLQNATNITSTSATFNGIVTGDGVNAITALDFQHGPAIWDATSGGAFGATPNTAAANVVNFAFSANVTGLTCGTTYFMNARAAIAGGTTNAGNIGVSFTTSACAAMPTVTTDPASAVTYTTGVMNGTMSANGSAIFASVFVYGTSPLGPFPNFATGTPFSTGPNDANVAFSATATGLTCGVTSYYVANAENAINANSGAIRNFTTTACAAPAVTTTAPGTVSFDSGVVNGTVTANGSAIAATGFKYGTASGGPYNASVTATPSTTLSTDVNVAILATLTGLNCGTTYFYVATATSGIGSTVDTAANERSFTTTACGAPVVTTNPAGIVSQTTAEMNGAVDAGNSAVSATRFRYGTASANYTGSVDASPFTTAVNAVGVAFTATASGLKCGATYYYVAEAVNAAGTSTDSVLNEQTFTTAACPRSSGAGNGENLPPYYGGQSGDGGSGDDDWLVSPPDGAFGSSNTPFVWKLLADPEGDEIIYTLTICSGAMTDCREFVITPSARKVALTGSAVGAGMVLIGFGLIAGRRRSMSMVIALVAIMSLGVAACGKSGDPSVTATVLA